LGGLKDVSGPQKVLFGAFAVGLFGDWCPGKKL
jgi:hypothetical protein